jgi:hypothetical protein
MLHPARLLLAAILSAPLLAQDSPEREPRFYLGLGLASGTYDYKTEGSLLDGDTGAGLLRLQFEATSAAGFGGGLRLEGIVSDDDLFVDAGFPATEAKIGSLFAHFTWRLQTDRFAMPMRAGFLFDSHQLEDVATSQQLTFASGAFQVEVAPELALIAREGFHWTAYGELGLGVGSTTAEIDGDPNEYDSDSSFAGLEIGTRFRFGLVELGLAYVGRFQDVDQSDVVAGNFVFGYEAAFQGAMLTVGFVF